MSLKDPTKIEIHLDPLVERINGRTAHKGLEFDCPLISQIEEKLYMGGCIHGAPLPKNINHVISLYPWEKYKPSRESKIRSCLEIEAYDGSLGAFENRLESIVEWAHSCWKDGVLLIHCQAGLNRSGLITALLLMKIRQDWNAYDAINRLRRLRSPAVLCNDSFESYLLHRYKW